MANLSRLLRLKLGADRQAGGLSAHPDANLLAAFAEHTLLKRERAAVTAHLAACAGCREYLALVDATRESEPVLVEAPVGRRLFTAWRLLAAVAVACVVVVVLLPRERRIASPAASPAIVAGRGPAPLSLPPAAPEPPKLSVRRQVPRSKPLAAPQAGVSAPVEMADASRSFEKAIKLKAEASNGPELKKDRQADALRAPEYAKSTQGGQVGGVIGGVLTIANRFAPPPGDAPSQTQQRAQTQGALPALLPPPAAQPYGRMKGRVTDASGAAIPGATVNAVNTATNAGVPAVTDRAGNFEVDGLAPGSYRLSAQAPGFRALERGPVALGAGDVSNQDLRLDVGSMSETVTVAADAVTVQAESAAAVPLAGRAVSQSRTRWSVNASGVVVRSFDGGTTWQTVPLGRNVIIHAVASDGSYVWAGGTHGVLFCSSDAGLHWKKTKAGAATIVSIDAQNRSRLKVADSAGDEWISVDSGLHWKK